MEQGATLARSRSDRGDDRQEAWVEWRGVTLPCEVESSNRLRRASVHDRNRESRSSSRSYSRSTTNTGATTPEREDRDGKPDDVHARPRPAKEPDRVAPDSLGQTTADDPESNRAGCLPASVSARRHSTECKFVQLPVPSDGPTSALRTRDRARERCRYRPPPSRPSGPRVGSGAPRAPVGAEAGRERLGGLSTFLARTLPTSECGPSRVVSRGPHRHRAHDDDKETRGGPPATNELGAHCGVLR